MVVRYKKIYVWRNYLKLPRLSNKMAKRRRKGKKNYLWLGIKGFFKLIWIGIKWIGLAFYYVLVGIGWLVHKISGRAKGPQTPSDTVVDVKAKDTSDKSDSKDTIENKKAKKKRKPAEGELPPTFEELKTIKTTQGDFEQFSESYLTKSQIILIFGKRGSGKSTLGFRMMENIQAKKKRPSFVLGVKQSLLPSWIDSVESVDEVRNGGVILVDEGAIAFSARQSMKKGNVELGKMLAIARHKDLTLIFITQNTGMIDRNVLNLTDVVIAKEGSLLQKKMERPVVRDFVAKSDKAIKALERNERVAHCYIFSDDFEGLCKVSLPSFWSTKISKSRA